MSGSLHGADRVDRVLAYVLSGVLATLPGFYETLPHLQAHNRANGFASCVPVIEMSSIVFLDSLVILVTARITCSAVEYIYLLMFVSNRDVKEEVW